MALLSAALLRITRRPARGPLLAAGIAGLIALGAITFLIHGDLTTFAHWRMGDLDVYRDGGRTVLNGGPLYAMRSRENLLFTYPPAAGLLAVPLALLSWPAAQLAWIAVVYVPLAVVTWFAFAPLLRRAGRYAPAVFAAVFLAGAYLLPLRQEMRLGQVDIFLVALCVADCGARRPRWPRGMLIGLGTAIKLVPGVFIVYLLITGRRRAAGVAAATFAGLSGLAWAVSPRDSARYWTSAIFDSRRLGPNMPAANQALRGILLRLVSPAPLPVALWLGVALAVAIAGFAAARAVHRRGPELAGVAITGLLAALLSPVAWIHHFCWVVVALGVIIGDGRRPRRVAAAVAAGALFTSTLPLYGKALLADRAVPVLAARVMEAGFGAGALALIVVLARIRYTPAEADQAAAGPRPERSAPDVEDMLLTGSRDG